MFDGVATCVVKCVTMHVLAFFTFAKTDHEPNIRRLHVIALDMIVSKITYPLVLPTMLYILCVAWFYERLLSRSTPDGVTVCIFVSFTYTRWRCSCFLVYIAIGCSIYYQS